MLIYIINIIISTLIAMIDSVKRNGKNKISWITIIFIVGLWAIFYSFRGTNVGTDTSGYIHGYFQLMPELNSITDVLNGSSDKLFIIIEYYCNKISHANWHFFAFIFSLITYIPIMIVLKKQKTKYFAMSVWVYIALLQCYYGYNGVRQAAAIGITFYAYNIFFKENKYLQYFIFMIVAFGFHSTALFIIPIHFLSKLKLNSKILWFIVIVLFLSSFSFSSVWNAAISTLSFFGNDVLAERYAFNNYGGSGILRVLVCLAPVILGIWKYKSIRKYESDIDSEIILLIFTSIFMIFSTSNWLFARIAAYFDIYVILLAPKLRYAFSKNCRVSAVILICLLYMGYMIAMLLHKESGLYPYNFFIL